MSTYHTLVSYVIVVVIAVTVFRCSDAPVCGDASIEGDEVCDDGNNSDSDLCAADCSAIGQLTIGFHSSNPTGPSVIALTVDGELRVAPLSFGSDIFIDSIGQELARLGSNCGVDKDGNVLSFGAPSTQLMMRTCSAGFFHGCGLDDAGRVSCWGRQDAYDPIPPGEFLEVEVGEAIGLSCAIRTDGELTCWGSALAEIEESELPVGPFRALAMGSRSPVCGLTDDGSIRCVGNVHEWTQGGFIDLSIGTFQVCAVDSSHVLRCSSNGSSVPPILIEPGFLSVVSDTTFSCGITTSGTIRCFEFPPAGA